MLGVHNNTSNLAVYGETGRYPLLLRQKIQALKYWHRIQSMNENSLFRMVYNLFGLHNCGFKTWVSLIESMLGEEGLQYVWESQSCDQSIINIFSNSVYDRDASIWRSTIQDENKCPKLRTYCTFKIDTMYIFW